MSRVRLVVVGALAALTFVYFKVVRPWTMRWITRLRVTFPPVLTPKMLYAVIVSTGDIVMIRKALRGIKSRAERVRSISELG